MIIIKPSKEADFKRQQERQALLKVAEISSLIAEFLRCIELGAGSSKLLSRLDQALEDLYEVQK